MSSVVKKNVMVVVFAVCFFGFVAFIVSQLFGIRSLPPYLEAINLVRKNAQVVGRIGSNIEPCFWVKYRMSYESFGKSIYMVIPVKGSRANAYVHVEAYQIGGVWELKLLQVYYAEDDVQDIVR